MSDYGQTIGRFPGPSNADLVDNAHRMYVNAVNTNDIARFAETIADDVIYFPPNALPVVGARDVLDWIGRYFDDVQTHCVMTKIERIAADNFAYVWYKYTSIDVPRNGGSPVTDTGNGVQVYERDRNGTWRVFREIWSSAIVSTRLKSVPRRGRFVGLAQNESTSNESDGTELGGTELDSARN
jgi:ketosteroid isomerase-like protein